MEEIYKTFKETTNHLWEVSNYGNIRKDGVVLEQKLFNNYLMCCGKFVHRLVAQTFLPNPENKWYVDHIDTNRLNNNVNNLRWVTPSENCRNPITHHRVVEGSKNAWSDERRRKYSEMAHLQFMNTSDEMREKIRDKISEANKNTKFVNKDNKTIRIPNESLIEYLENGYIYGMTNSKSRVRIYKNNKGKQINRNDLLTYLKQGYKLRK